MDENLQASACPDYEALLEDLVSGVLVGPDAQAAAKNLSEHLQGCVGCRAALDAASFSAHLLRLAQPTPEPGPAFARVVMARIRAEREQAAGEKTLWKLFVPLAWRFAATATLALVALVTYDVTTLNRQPQRDLAVVRSSAPGDIFPDPTSLPRNRDEVLLMVAESNHGNH